MTGEPVESTPAASSRARSIGARILTVVAILLALVGALAFYVEHTALDEDGFETISREMIENDAIRAQVAKPHSPYDLDRNDPEAAVAGLRVDGAPGSPERSRRRGVTVDTGAHARSPVGTTGRFHAIWMRKTLVSGPIVPWTTQAVFPPESRRFDE